MTKSDQHHYNLQDYVNIILNSEKRAIPSSNQPVVSVDGGNVGEPPKSGGNKQVEKHASGRKKSAWRLVIVFVWVIILASMILIGIKGWQVYQLMQVVNGDFSNLEKFDISSLNSGSLEQVGTLLDKTHNDIATLHGQVQQWLGLGKVLGWLPVYGGDLKNSGDLLELGSDLTEAGSQTYKAALPIWQSVQANQGNLQADALTEELLNAQPALSEAQIALGQAELVRQRININELTPTTGAFIKSVDAYLSSFKDGLSLALSIPVLMGEGKDGPKTYLILIQNEDELRPTGGFITAVGKIVIENGKLISWNIEDSYSVDDINKAYPSAPWQLQSFMNIPIMTFRDSNWFPDFPTAVMWARYLYAYTDTSPLNGMITIDQHVLKTLLSVTGPLYVDEINTTVSSDNVEQIMRMQKVQPPADQRTSNWSRKQFMTPIAGAILNKISSGQGLFWEQLLKAMKGELDQRHILVDLNDQALSKLLMKRGWDGSVTRSDGDFLMVIDTNMGYNKTNAVVGSNLIYDVGLTDLTNPSSNLAVVHHNSAQGPTEGCQQGSASIDRSNLEYWYPIDRCYFDYLRVYSPAGTQLKSATPHAVSRDAMTMLDENVPPRVDILDESIQGLQGFGTLLVVPTGQSVETDFQFNLPAGILKSDLILRDLVYQLKVQKQPGTEAIPITVRVHLPQGSKIRSVGPEGFITDGNNLLFNLALSEDVYIRIEFQP